MRDDFSKATVELLAKRAGYLCSNPECGMLTVGATPTEGKSMIVGVAAHITAAAPGGPRFDPALSPEQRAHHSNGIWLCEIHGKVVDSDADHFTFEMLRKWKETAEANSLRSILTLKKAVDVGTTAVAPSATGDLSAVTEMSVRAAKADLAGFKREASWPRHAIRLNLRINDGKVAQAFDIGAVATANRTFNEIVIVASPGTGKTTTLVQLAETMLAFGELVAAFVPLGEWSSQSSSLLQSVRKRHSFANITEQDLSLLAEAGRLVLILDGWNELDAVSRKRAAAEVRSLQREFVSLGIVVSTRRQALDVPISGPLVEIDALTANQQLEIARALRGSKGETILDHAWRTAGLRELVAIPLYLTTLLGHAPDGSLPTTKEEVLRSFVEEHEKPAEKAAALRESLFGFHAEMLRALAVEATRRVTTILSDGVSRAVIASVEDQLVTDRQISQAPQPTAVLDTLVSLHMLVRIGDGISFQHQQFQEWYASFAVEELMRKSAGNDASWQKLRTEVLNEYAWEESILFACERVSRSDQDGVQAVGRAILETIGIDPMLAAEMIYRSDVRVWGLIKDRIVDFATRWHQAGNVDRAARFMITTGRSDFAPQIWKLISSPDDQVYLSAFRTARRFRPSVLGGDIQARISELPEEHRQHVVSQIAQESGPDGIELAAQLAQSDNSLGVKVSTVEALQFRRADRLVADILRRAPDEVWVKLAHDGYAGEVADAAAAMRLRDEQKKLIDAVSDPVSKIRELLKAGRNGLVGSEVAKQIEDTQFPGNDQQAGWLVMEAFKSYPNDVGKALLHRLESGHEIPFRSEELLQATEPAIDDGPVTELVLRADTTQRIAVDACSVVGSKTAGRLVDAFIKMDGEIKAAGTQITDATRERYHNQMDRISVTNATSFLTAVLERSGTSKPEEIGLLAELISRHGKRDEGSKLQIPDRLRQDLIAVVGKWGEVLISSPSSTRSQFANVARVVERLGAPELVSVLNRMLIEDLTRWRKTREEFLASAKRGVRLNTDAHTCYKLQYSRAFAAIGGDAVAELLKSYLPDPGFYGFGLDAAGALKEILDRQQQKMTERPFVSWPDFSGVRARSRRIERQGQSDGGKSSAFAEAILSVVRDLIQPDKGKEAHNYALELACIAFGLPYGEERNTIDALLALPQALRTRQKLLTVLALAGEIVPSEMVLDGIRSLAEEFKKRQWFSDNEWWEWEGWLKLMPFSDKPAATIDALELLPKPVQPWRLRGLLSALAHSPSPEAEDVLVSLPRKYEGFLGEYDWLGALENRGIAVAGRTLLGFICEGAYASKPGGVDAWTLYRKLAAAMRMDPDFRTEVYQRYERNTCGPGCGVLEMAIAEGADEAGVLLLIRNYARQGKPFDGALHTAIRHVAVGERPSEDWVGATVSFSIDVSRLRKELFRMISGETSEAKLAKECLNAIDELRDEHGAPESEPRHPDIESGRPWPMVG